VGCATLKSVSWGTTEDGDDSLRAALQRSRKNLQAATDRAENLEIALQSSRRIGIAMGILMAHRGLREADAFHCLVQASQQQNRKLAQVAEDVVYTGHL